MVEQRRQQVRYSYSQLCHTCRLAAAPAAAYLARCVTPMQSKGSSLKNISRSTCIEDSAGPESHSILACLILTATAATLILVLLLLSLLSSCRDDPRNVNLMNDWMELLFLELLRSP